MSPQGENGARAIAASVLLRVWEDGAFAAAALSAQLNDVALDSRDKGLATELVYGVLRTQPYLTRRIQAFGTAKEGDEFVLAHLLIATYQIDFLDRVPARAAVHEAVSAIQRERGQRLGGFANAVLRRVSEAKVTKAISLQEAIYESTPSWLRKRLERSIGAEGTRVLLTDVKQAMPTLRLAQGHEAPAWFATETEALEGGPSAYRYTGGGDPRQRAEFTDGAFVVQELGAQLIARVPGLQVGQRVLDVCAGRGQKTAVLAERTGPHGQVFATDIHAHKLAALQAELKLDGSRLQTQLCDWTEPPPERYHAAFDFVLVDAPCTGVGTLRRRPEILRRLTPEDPERLRDLQVKILSQAAVALAPGGTLVYATCSVLGAEAEDVLDGVADVLEPRPFGQNELATIFPPDSTSTRLLPHVHGTDGYFVARLARRARGH